MNVSIKASGSVALVAVEVDLNEWGGKYPDDSGVLNRALLNIQDSLQAAAVDASQKIDEQIIALQEKKAALEQSKPEVVIDDTVAKVADAGAAEPTP